MTRTLAIFSALLFLSFPIRPSAAGVPTWSDRFYLNGADGEIYTLLVHDAALYAAGRFAHVGPLSAAHIARFDGSEWSALGDGVDGDVYAMAEYGGDVVVAGSFQRAGGVSATNIARWDGSAWHALGDGLPTAVRSLIVFDGDLIAGTEGGYMLPPSAMRWDGTAWSPMGGGFMNRVTCFAVYRGELMAGSFAELYDVPSDSVSFAFVWRWTDSGWVPLTTGPPYGWIDYNPEIVALQVIDDRLYALGDVMLLGESCSLCDFCYWDGASWHQVPFGWSSPSAYVDEHPGAVLPYKGKLLLGGMFWGALGGASHSVSLYDGAGWSPLQGGGLQYSDIYGNDGPRVHAMVEFQGGVYVAGGFNGAGDRAAASIARWDGEEWGEVVSSGQAVSGIVETLAYWNERLVVGGFLNSAGPQTADAIAVLDNGSFEPMPGLGGWVRSLVAYGGGVVAAGCIWGTSGNEIRGAAAWDGSKWSTLGSGAPAEVLTTWQGDLIAGGETASGGGVVSRWDGVTWSQVGSDLAGRVTALEAHDGVLYAAGEFQGGVVEWAGQGWQGVGRTFTSRVSDMQSTPDGLFVCEPRGLSQWDGLAWRSVPIPQGQVTRLGALNGDLLAGGSFTFPGVSSQVGLIRRTNGGWLPVEGSPGGGISAIVTNATDLAVGGSFRSAGDLQAWGVATRHEGETPITPVRIAPARVAESLDSSSEGCLRAGLGGEHDFAAWGVTPLREVQVSPNPTRGAVTFSFDLPASAAARIEIFDASGRAVATLADRSAGPGRCTIAWDGRDSGGRLVPGGVYWMRLRTGGELRTARIVRIR